MARSSTTDINGSTTDHAKRRLGLAAMLGLPVLRTRIRGRSIWNVPPRSTSTRSPVPVILGSLAAGAILALALLLGPASGSSEPVITGSVLLAFGLGWGLMAFLSTRFSAQPPAW